MKQVFQRIGIYLLILFAWNVVDGSWLAFNQPNLVDRATSYAAYFLITGVVWIGFCEAVFHMARAAIHNIEKRRLANQLTKELEPTPDTQPLRTEAKNDSR